MALDILSLTGRRRDPVALTLRQLSSRATILPSPGEQDDEDDELTRRAHTFFLVSTTRPAKTTPTQADAIYLFERPPTLSSRRPFDVKTERGCRRGVRRSVHLTEDYTRSRSLARRISNRRDRVKCQRCVPRPHMGESKVTHERDTANGSSHERTRRSFADRKGRRPPRSRSREAHPRGARRAGDTKVRSSSVARSCLRGAPTRGSKVGA